MNILETLTFAEKNFEVDRLDCELLLCYVLKLDRLHLYINANKELTSEQVEFFERLLKRRQEHEPLAYLVNHKEFGSLEFTVTNEVLVPRPETEILVDAVINRLKIFNGEIKFADIGVGSGAIVISILQQLKNSAAEAVDISEAALEVARLNAERYNLLDRIIFHCGDLTEPLTGKKFDLIVSNPPYIPSKIIETLQPEVAKYEPRIALDGGADGLNFYRRLIKETPELLVDGGFLAVEIGSDQASAVQKIIVEDGRLGEVEVIKDLAGLYRVVIARKI